jgi:predicted nuclease of predicted toxin-antitoxin system
LKLRDFPILTDENIDPDVVAGLRRLGFDVLDVVESGRAGASDVDLLRWAKTQGRVIVSHDSDFGTLAILQTEPLVGLVFLRPGHIDPKFTMATIGALLNADPDVTPPFVLVARRTGSQVTIRVRALGA